MVDLIDREELLRRYHTAMSPTTPMHSRLAFLEMLVETAKPVDAVPVIRCRDCEHWTMLSSGERICDIKFDITPALFYCGAGKNRYPEGVEEHG